MMQSASRTFKQKEEAHIMVTEEIIKHLKKQLENENQQVEWYHKKWKEHERETLRLREMIQNLEE